jgi:hypothetical protein
LRCRPAPTVACGVVRCGSSGAAAGASVVNPLRYASATR